LQGKVSTGAPSGNVGAQEAVLENVTITDIHTEIETLSEQRQDLWHRLSDGLDLEAQAELKEIDSKLTALWETLRTEKARMRFGERDEIVRRARAEERLERAA
jgi:hypothetical protein